MQRTEIQVNLGERSYPIVVVNNALDGVGAFARSRSKSTQAFIICDENTQPLVGSQLVQSFTAVGFRTQGTVLPAGEETKSLDQAGSLFEQLVEMKADRGTLVVAAGGGVIGDLAGFVAATFARGIPFLQVPTSLLAQVDSSVGGKVAVNLLHRASERLYKNMVGAFYQPVGVFIDTAILGDLPLPELRSGLAEVVKYGVILDAEFFAFLEQHAEAIMNLDATAISHAVVRSCRLKADVVEADERETSDRRAVLNYGHTFAHAIEAVSREYRHGEAVAIGMVAASRLAQQLGRIDADVTDRQVRLLRRLGLPTSAPNLDPAQLLAAMQHDKKVSAGRLRFVLPNRIGEVEVCNDVPVAAVRAVLDEMVTHS